MAIQATDLYGSQGNQFVAAPAPSVAENAGRAVSGDMPNLGNAFVGIVLALVVLRLAYEFAGK